MVFLLLCHQLGGGGVEWGGAIVSKSEKSRKSIYFIDKSVASDKKKQENHLLYRVSCGFRSKKAGIPFTFKLLRFWHRRVFSLTPSPVLGSSYILIKN